MHDDEDKSWQSIIIGAGASVILLLLAYFLMTTRSFTFNTGVPEKILQFDTVFVTGRKDGQKIWEARAQSGWSNKNSVVTELYNLTDGKSYKDGRLIMKNIKAAYARYLRDAEVLIANKEPLEKPPFKCPPILQGDIDIGYYAETKAGQKKEEFSFFQSDSLKYFHKEKRSEIMGNITLRQKDLWVKAQQMLVDHENKSAIMEDRARLKKGKISLTSQRLDFLAKSEEITAQNSVNAFIDESERTRVKCNWLLIPTDKKQKRVNMKDSVRVFQAKKAARSDWAEYFEDKKELNMFSRVVIFIQKGGDFFNLSTLKRLDNPTAREIASNKTTIWADRVLVSTRTENATCEGQVKVFQKEREAKSDYAFYDDKEEKIWLWGNVYTKDTKDSRWLKADQVLVSVQDETFTALGSVESEFKIKTKRTMKK